MAEEVKQVVEETVAQVDEASAEVKKAAKKAAGSGKDSVIEQAKGSGEGRAG